jgi:hypothetical protein
MTTEQFLNILFDAHSRDLQEIYKEENDIFVCPICLTGFSREAIHEKILTDGHVWPKHIRANSEEAKSMHVLLCADCNHNAGARGDAQMQLSEKIRKDRETGKLGQAKLLFIRKKDGIQINMNVDSYTYHPETNSATATTKIDKNIRWRNNNPKDQQDFEETYRNNEFADLIILPPNNFKPELIHAGWITSAYLMGFYCLGYRFIFDKSLDPVRKYILNSFDKSLKLNPIQLNPDNFGIWEQTLNQIRDPELLFVIPFEVGKPVFLQANCLSHGIRIPFRYKNISVLAQKLYENIPNCERKLDEFRESKKTIYFRISYNKRNGDHSWFDDLLGTPKITCEPLAENNTNEKE